MKYPQWPDPPTLSGTDAPRLATAFGLAANVLASIHRTVKKHSQPEVLNLRVNCRRFLGDIREKWWALIMIDILYKLCVIWEFAIQDQSMILFQNLSLWAYYLGGWSSIFTRIQIFFRICNVLTIAERAFHMKGDGHPTMRIGRDDHSLLLENRVDKCQHYWDCSIYFFTFRVLGNTVDEIMMNQATRRVVSPACIHRYVYLFIYLSIYLFIYLSIYIYLFIYILIYLSIYFLIYLFYLFIRWWLNQCLWNIMEVSRMLKV